jgi:UPF0755 protein
MMSTGPLPPSRHGSRWGKRIAGVVTLAIALILVGAAVLLLRGPSQSTDYVGTGTGAVTVTVSSGDTLTEIGTKLQKAGVVLSAQSFVNAAAVDDRASSIGPGRYAMRRQMNSVDALNLMLDPASRADSRLVLPEGLRLEQTVQAASAASDLPKSDFQKVLQDPSQLGLPPWAHNRPEGFMFPATYDLTGEETAASLLKSFVKRFKQSSDDIGLESRAKDVGLTPYEVLTVASILQAEVHPGDYAKVARVIYNRLAARMPLGLDTTVAYALGVSSVALTADQLKTDSPYNTYVHPGLPPGPINSPGDAAIEAALTPAKGKWLYFVTVDPATGETKFARTYAKFLQLKDEFQRNYAEFQKKQAASSPSASAGANG